ncbi:hypothetical protein [Pseudoduganella umbonata]|uniref:Uncharacterized protein n=1 Tax=Pseudoduganella umbonata TaxID=864828 RepID=A0A4P8HND0_9BURK|nr:hypothetical protein [Pseudoduganella umbonata]MBB3224429.1 hypothetical protein [Pseudoduganella umbonata]QCP11213.1 hypothetical protein FCL38_12895 [Pseudoduganella umbonata]
MNESIDREFDAISQKLINACADPTFGEDRLEPLYVQFLEFLSRNEESRQQLVARILQTMKKYRTAREVKGRLLPGTAIAYAMHELRWPEIYDFAEAENREYYVKRMETLMSNLIDAYSDDWEDRFFYERFQ